MQNNAIGVNRDAIEKISLLSKKVIDALFTKTSDDMLQRPKDGAALEKFNDDIDVIIADKLRKKFNVV